MAIRQARPEPLALSVSGHERMMNGRAAASDVLRIDLAGEIAWFGEILDFGSWETLREIVVNWVCRDRADHLWQFDVRSKPACRPVRAAVRGCMLIDTRKPGRPSCRSRKNCRLAG